MYATQLIAELAKMVAVNGDLVVTATWYHTENNGPVSGMAIEDGNIYLYGPDPDDPDDPGCDVAPWPDTWKGEHA